jgi:hypothetical protein
MWKRLGSLPRAFPRQVSSVTAFDPIRRRLSDNVAWVAPLVLAAYFVWQFAGIWVGVRGDLVWLVLVAGAVILGVTVGRRGPTAVELMAIEVLAASLLNGYQNSRGGELRDLRLYLAAGQDYLAGMSPYTTVPLRAYPADLSQLPFLYPPPTLPVFAFLSLLPFTLVAPAWVAASAVGVLISLRAFGLSWRWAALGLAWFPVEQALYTGNVAALSLLVLAFGPALPGILPLGALLKPQNGILALWLIRQRHWRMLILGMTGLSAIVVATLPITGIWLWQDWANGLLAYQASEQNLRGLYGVGLARYLALPIFLGVALLVISAALASAGRPGLARLGLASVVASPSLWSHGFLFAVPAFLHLRARWFWLVVGFLSVGAFPGPHLALAIAGLAWFAPWMTREKEVVTQFVGPHPLGATTMAPWPQTSHDRWVHPPAS